MNKYLQILFILYSTFTFGQEPFIYNFNSKDNVPEKTFYDIIEDKDGLIWLASVNGLYNFDGENFNKINEATIGNKSIFNFKKDKKNTIWCNTLSGDLIKINKESIIVNSILTKNDIVGNKLSKISIFNDLVQLSNANYDAILNLKDSTVTKNRKTIENDTLLFDAVNYKNILFKSFLINGKHLISSQKKLKTKESKIVFNKRIGTAKNSLYHNNDHLLFLAKLKKGNKIYSFKNEVFEELDIPNTIARTPINKIQFYKENFIFSTMKGVFFCTIKKNRLIITNNYLKDEIITSTIIDKNNAIWCTSLNNGLFIIQNSFLLKHQIDPSKGEINSLDKFKKTIFFGTNKGFLGLINTQNNKIKYFKLDNHRVSTLKFNPYKNDLYVSTDENFFIFDIKSSKLKRIPKSKIYASVKYISILNKEYILASFHRDSKKIKVKKGEIISSKIINNYRSYNNYFDNNSNTSFFTDRKGTFIIKQDSTLKYLEVNNKKVFANSICKTSDNKIWIYDSHNNLLRYTKDSLSKKRTLKDGFSTKAKIIPSKNNIIYISKRGLSKINTITNKTKIFNTKLTSKPSEINDIIKLNEKIWFCSNHGLFSINENKFSEQETKKVKIKRIEINNKEIDSTSKNIKLKSEKNKIRIHLENYGLFNNNNIKYKLENFNPNWENIGKNGIIEYNNLEEGEYQLLINHDSFNYTDLISSINICINKPFYQKPFFFILLGSLLACILFFVFQKLNLKNKKLKTKEEEIKQMMMELAFTKSKINDNFIIKNINLIQQYILDNNNKISQNTINKFKELSNLHLAYIDKKEISISVLLIMTKNLLFLEKKRLNNRFEYSINLDMDISKGNILLPKGIILEILQNTIKNVKEQGRIQLFFTTDTSETYLKFKILFDSQKDSYEEMFNNTIDKKISLLNLENKFPIQWSFKIHKVKKDFSIYKYKILIPLKF